MICLDLDGTLLNDKKEVSEKNIGAINKLYQDYGVVPVIVTGKNLAWAEHILSLFNKSIPKYAIVSNGGIVKDLNKGVYIKNKYFTDDMKVKVQQMAKKYGFEIDYQIENDNIEDVDIPFDELVLTQMSLFGEEGELKLAIEELNATETLETTGIMTWVIEEDGITHESTYIDIMAKGSTKANGILILLRHLDLEIKDIITMGDGANDIPMFELGGFNVVMDNASDELKKYADYITASNNENGVAKAIEYIFYSKE